MSSTDLQTVFPDPKTGVKRPAVWRDWQSVLHRVVGSQMISSDRGAFVIWTACGKTEVPANGPWLQRPGDEVCCSACQIAEEEFTA